MYALTDEQVSSLETFIGKIPESIIRSHIEKWFQEVEPSRRITSEEMGKFIGFSTHLPQSVQNFPQSFLMAVKNTPHTEIAESEHKEKDKTNLTSLVDESIEDVDDAEAPENVEQTLHTLGKNKKATPVKKDKK